MNRVEDKFEKVRLKLMGMRFVLVRESRAEMERSLMQGDEYRGDDADLAGLAFSEAMKAAMSTRHHGELKAIEVALLRIEDGSFGICEDCDEEIPIKRLYALPFARRCIECQERHEKMKLEEEARGAYSSFRNEDECDK